MITLALLHDRLLDHLYNEILAQKDTTKFRYEEIRKQLDLSLRLIEAVISRDADQESPNFIVEGDYITLTVEGILAAESLKKASEEAKTTESARQHKGSLLSSSSSYALIAGICILKFGKNDKKTKMPYATFSDLSDMLPREMGISDFYDLVWKNPDLFERDYVSDAISLSEEGAAFFRSLARHFATDKSK